ncbi:MAG: MlaD family protein [Gillisia sp.]|nr:MlaD family protein [Gillisia sp.]
MKKNTSQNIKLGIFVIMGSILLVLAVYFIGSKKDLFQNTSKISSVFKNVSGLQIGNNVRLSGVNVGTVRGIEILTDTAIVVDMFIDDNTFHLIKKNSIATIISDGLVGSMMVDIRPGKEHSDEIIKPGDTLRSISRIPTSEMLRTLRITNKNAALLTKDLLKITNAINNGEGVIGALLKDDKLEGNIKQTFSNLEQTSKNANRAINRLNEILDDVNLKEGVAGVLLSDTTSANNMRGIFVSLEKAAKDIDSMTSNLNQFSADVKNSQGPLNFVLNDTTFVKNLDSTIQNSEDASAKFNEIMDALKQSFLFRGYFRKLERQKEKQAECLENI